MDNTNTPSQHFATPLRPSRLSIHRPQLTHNLHTASRHLAPQLEEPKTVYTRPTTIGAGRKNSPIRFWPFVAILAAGTYGFSLMVSQRSGTKSEKDGQNVGSRPF